jgi:hypothetical protein
VIDARSLGSVKTILVHGGGCPDGIASAILLHDALPGAKVRFIQYGSQEHWNLEPEPGMLFADLTPKEARLEEFITAGTIVLDHHKAAKDIVARFGENAKFGDEDTEPGVCGAVLCFRHVWPMIPPTDPRMMDAYESVHAREFATLAGIRDTWQRNHPRWEDACAQAEVLRFYPEENWLSLKNPFTHEHDALWTERRGFGKLLREKHLRAIKGTIDKACRVTTKAGTRAVLFEGTGMTNEVADTIEDADLVIGFGYEVDHGIKKFKLSCRSRNGYNCMALAKSFGGGGHSGAAGFNIQITESATNPFHHAELLVNEHEARSQK